MPFLYFLENLRNPVLDAIMLTVTRCGEEMIFIVLAMILLWCVDKYEGYYLLTVGFIGTQINNFLKVTFRIERPWVLDPNFKPIEGSMEAATGYSFPSGHTQSAVGSFGAVARWSKTRWLRILCCVICVLVPLSRMYLGVHTPLDVSVSFVIATVMVLAFYPPFRKIEKNPNIMRILLSVMMLWSVLLVLYMMLYPFPADAMGEELESGLKTAYKMAGATFGLAIVYELDVRYIKFDTTAIWWAQILKLVLGLALTLGVKELCYLLFGAICPAPADRALSYFVMVIFAGSVWPLTFPLFSKLGQKK